MVTWVLVFYMSAGVGTVATGGPSAIDGFKTESACQSAMVKMNQKFGSKFDWGTCISVEK